MENKAIIEGDSIKVSEMKADKSKKVGNKDKNKNKKPETQKQQTTSEEIPMNDTLMNELSPVIDECVKNKVIKIEAVELDEYEKKLNHDMVEKLGRISKQVKDNIHNFYKTNLITVMKENEKLREEIVELQEKIARLTPVKLDASSQTSMDEKPEKPKVSKEPRGGISEGENKNWKSLLQEFSIVVFKETPIYETVDVGDCHKHLFVSKVNVGGHSVSGGVKETKRKSEQSAAYELYNLLLS
jgi:hypothetical protein